MNLLSSALLLGAAVASSLTFTACGSKKKDPAAQGELALQFDHVVGSRPLVLNTDTYTNGAGNPFTVTTFNYYISNIRLTQADGTEWAEPESYHLIKENSPASKKLTLTGIPAGDYRKLTFTIGVDSARNVAGAQTGALDPLNDMFWTWNTGYVYTKLEGTSPQAPGNGSLVFHVGGFRWPNNTIRTVAPALPANTVLAVRAGRAPQVHLKVDVLSMFNGPTAARTVDFRTLSNVMGGPNAKLLADNYATGLFRVEHVR
ncbi:hypothetical protein GCM10027048_43910 [Hymenobacter coalescens]